MADLLSYLERRRRRGAQPSGRCPILRSTVPDFRLGSAGPRHDPSKRPLISESPVGFSPPLDLRNRRAPVILWAGGTHEAPHLGSSVKGTGGLDVFCRNGVVVLAGVVEGGSRAGTEAGTLAGRAEGVKRVETYFLPAQPSKLDDFTIKRKINAKLVRDGDLKAGQVDMAVIAGHVVLVGIVDRPEKIDKIIAHARATDGVVVVKSFIQL